MAQLLCPVPSQDNTQHTLTAKIYFSYRIMSDPTTTPAWVVTAIDRDSFSGLTLRENSKVPELGDHDVLVQIEAVSLNYRDLAIPRVSF